MFTGIVSDVGALARRNGGQLAIRCRYPTDTIALGASIACDGCCLTVTSVRESGDGSEFTVDVSNETLSRTTLGGWQQGRRINLERALKAGEELGGHLVTGHVDGLARIAAIESDGDSRRITLSTVPQLSSFIAAKGSVTLDGTSLTVNEVAGERFCVNLVPHTLTVTTWGSRKPGDDINLEVDLIARYVGRLMEHSR